MLIVDSQIHIWENGLPTNPAHRQIPVYSKDDALRDMDAAGVDAAVLPSRPPGSIPTASPSWGISRSSARRAAPW